MLYVFVILPPSIPISFPIFKFFFWVSLSKFNVMRQKNLIVSHWWLTCEHVMFYVLWNSLYGCQCFLNINWSDYLCIYIWLNPSCLHKKLTFDVSLKRCCPTSRPGTGPGRCCPSSPPRRRAGTHWSCSVCWHWRRVWQESPQSVYLRSYVLKQYIT